MEGDYVTRLDEIAALRQQVKIAREALEDVETECDPSDPEWTDAVSARAYLFSVSTRALKLMDHPDAG